MKILSFLDVLLLRNSAAKTTANTVANTVVIPLAIALSLLSSSPVALAANEDSADSIQLIGLDANHTPVTQEIPSLTYRKSVATAFQSVQNSILPILNDPAQNPSNSFGGLQLNSISVNLGVGLQIGLGPLFSTTLTSEFQLIYSDSVKPIFPD